MSKHLSTAASAMFDAEVHHLFQGAARLDGTVEFRGNVVGDIYNFRRMGKGTANQKASQQDVTPMDATHTKIPVTLQNWNAPEYTDIFDQAEVNFQERAELVMTIGKALGRRKDQLVIDALAAASGGTVAKTIGTSDGLQVTKLRAALALLGAVEADDEEMFLVYDHNGHEQILGLAPITSSDFTRLQALDTAQVPAFLGIGFRKIGTRSEGGLPASGNDFDAFVWARTAVGLAEGIGPATEVNYIPQKTSWLSNGIMKANAVSRDDTGVVKVTYDSTAVIAQGASD